MPKTIIELVRETQQVLAVYPALAEENAARAVSAIIQGRSSEAYRTYMLQFVEKDGDGNPTLPLGDSQLTHLLADNEPTGDGQMNRRRAYMMANGVCGGGSPDNGGRFDFTVETIDDGINLAAPARAAVNTTAEANVAPAEGAAPAGAEG